MMPAVIDDGQPRLDRSGYEPAFADDFSGPELDPDQHGDVSAVRGYRRA